jgi:glycosyltransferase involved in cell wall biosynthesis
MPRVTVITATYNWSEVLRFSIASVLRQSFRDFEYLVIGDGCTDDSEQVVRSFGDPRVRWINLPENSKHQSGPNNEGLRQARGEIIAYLGHDDLWLPHHLESHVAALDAARADLSYSLVLLVANDEMYWTARPRPELDMFAPPSGTTHRKSVADDVGGWINYREYDHARFIAPERELWHRALAAGKKPAVVPRLTALKFPAGWRKDVYATRPCGEQARWTKRIETEPFLEQELLVNCIAGSGKVPSRIPYRALVRNLCEETVLRIRGRLALPRFGLRSANFRTIDEVRKFKGL